jgi:probable rRNA maturation factor
MNLDLDVQVATKSAGLPPKAAIGRWARAALKGLRRKHVALAVRIVDRREGAALNRRYRRKPRATNVLSFPFAPPAGVRSPILGDLVICAPVVRREARARELPEKAHWAHLVVHGILHLRGYDHQNDKDAARMESRESRILKGLGYADPYGQSRPVSQR